MHQSKVYEQPVVVPQLTHLWQLPLGTVIEPHSGQVGASLRTRKLYISPWPLPFLPVVAVAAPRPGAGAVSAPAVGVTGGLGGGRHLARRPTLHRALARGFVTHELGTQPAEEVVHDRRSPGQGAGFPVKPEGSKRVARELVHKELEGTPYCRASEMAVAKAVHEAEMVEAPLAIAYEDLARSPFSLEAHVNIALVSRPRICVSPSVSHRAACAG